MKAKELAELLLQTPDAEVVIFEYCGGCTPIRSINSVNHQAKGEKSVSYDGGDFVDDAGIVQLDMLIVDTYERPL